MVTGGFYPGLGFRDDLLVKPANSWVRWMSKRVYLSSGGHLLPSNRLMARTLCFNRVTSILWSEATSHPLQFRPTGSRLSTRSPAFADAPPRGPAVGGPDGDNSPPLEVRRAGLAPFLDPVTRSAGPTRFGLVRRHNRNRVPTPADLKATGRCRPPPAFDYSRLSPGIWA